MQKTGSTSGGTSDERAHFGYLTFRQLEDVSCREIVPVPGARGSFPPWLPRAGLREASPGAGDWGCPAVSRSPGSPAAQTCPSPPAKRPGWRLPGLPRVGRGRRLGGACGRPRRPRRELLRWLALGSAAPAPRSALGQRRAEQGRVKPRPVGTRLQTFWDSRCCAENWQPRYLGKLKWVEG